MLEKQQEIRNPVGAALLDQLPLERQGVVVSNLSQAPDLQLPEAGRARRGHA